MSRRVFRIFALLSLSALLLAGWSWYFPDSAIGGVIANKVNTYRLNQGLVGWWTFDGTDVTDKVYDRSGQGHHAYLQAGSHATNTMKVAGKIGQGLRFDGVSDQIVTNTIDLSGTGQVTYSFWLYESAGLSADVDPFSLYWVSQALWIASVSPSAVSVSECNSGETKVYARTTAGGNANCFTPPQSSGWHHYAVVLDMSQPASGEIVGYYLDGVVQTPLSQSETNNNTSPFPSDLVAVFDGWPNGTLDDVRIWSRALSASEVKLLYTSTAGSKLSSSKTNIPGSTLQSGLVGYWSFDGPDVTDKVYDRSGNSNHGYFSSGVATNSVKVGGKIGQALQFNGVSGSISAGSDASLDNIVNLTACAWIYPRSAGKLLASNHYGEIVTKSVLTGGWYFEVSDLAAPITLSYYHQFTNGSAQWGYWRAQSNAVPLNTWSHACVTYNDSSTANDPIFYVNGVSQTVTEMNTPLGSAIDDSSGTITIGDEIQGDETFNGTLDDVRVYNRILSAQEIKDLYSATRETRVSTSRNVVPGSTLQSGLVGLWSFDGTDVTDKVYDRSGNNNNGYFNGGATNTAKVGGKIGQALRFDGVDDYVNVGDINATDGASYLTVSAWVKENVAIADAGIATKWTTGTEHWAVGLNNAGCAAFAVVFNMNSSGGGCSPGGSHELGVWEHWVFVFDGTQSGNANRLKGYKNGAQVTLNFGAGTIPATTNSNTNPIYFGGDGSTILNGSLDDIRIYNRALSASEVKLLYNLGR